MYAQMFITYRHLDGIASTKRDTCTPQPLKMLIFIWNFTGFGARFKCWIYTQYQIHMRIWIEIRSHISVQLVCPFRLSSRSTHDHQHHRIANSSSHLIWITSVIKTRIYQRKLANRIVNGYTSYLAWFVWWAAGCNYECIFKYNAVHARNMWK